MDFQSKKSFGKLKLRAFQPYHQTLCILKHVGDVRDRSSTPKFCNAIYVGDIRDRNNLQYTQSVGQLSDASAQKELLGFFVRV